MNRTGIVFSIIAVLIFAISCKDAPKRDKNNANKPNKELKAPSYSFDNPPQFRKDGELQFLNSDSLVFSINVELSTNDSEHERGLMYRKQMDENQGMLFIFEQEEWRSFWMRNTIIPLDIIYVNAQKQVINVCKNAKVMDESSLPSIAPAMYVVEINAGLCEKYGIDAGTEIVF